MIKCRLVSNAVINQSDTVLNLFTSKHKALLVRWNILHALDLLLHSHNRIS